MVHQTIQVVLHHSTEASSEETGYVCYMINQLSIWFLHEVGMCWSRATGRWCDFDYNTVVYSQARSILAYLQAIMFKHWCSRVGAVRNYQSIKKFEQCSHLLSPTHPPLSSEQKCTGYLLCQYTGWHESSIYSTAISGFNEPIRPRLQGCVFDWKRKLFFMDTRFFYTCKWKQWKHMKTLSFQKRCPKCKLLK